MDDTTLINAWFSKNVQSSKMPDGYATEVIVPHTEQYAWKYSRYDVVFVIYHQGNLVRHDRKEEQIVI